MSHQDLPAPMHPRYQDFLSFMAYCPHRTSPSILEAAFWVWLNFIEIIDNNDLKSDHIQQLKTDLDRIHRERENFHIQCSAQAEEIERLNAKNAELQAKLDDVTLILLGGAIGERGHACMSVDGGNL